LKGNIEIKKNKVCMLEFIPTFWRIAKNNIYMDFEAKHRKQSGIAKNYIYVYGF
jgi:hypothetical protein